MSRLSARSPANWRAYDSGNLMGAMLLALLLILMWMFGRGPNAGGCCAGSVPTPAAVSAVTSTAAGLAWIADGKVTLTGVVKDEATKKALLDAAAAKYVAGNVIDQLTVNAAAASSKVVLTGSVAAEAEKLARGAWAASVYGPTVTIDNQLQVVSPTAPAAPAAPVALIGTAPPAVNVYFATGKTDIDAKDREAIATMLTYLKTNPSVKAIISGYHDPRGDKAMNEELAKNRAKSVRDVLIASGVEAGRFDMRKPIESTGTGDNAEARRVELRVE
jgi:outer membrane protein OmpA-like peptidoglycan-associated protein